MFCWSVPRGLIPRPRRTGLETSRLIVGSTGSGKSEGELADLIGLAHRGDHAVVLLDGHGPLAFRTAGHWAARGHEGRLVYEPLDATDRVLGWNMFHRSAAPTPSQRLLADAETREDIAQCFMAQRNLATLADKPWTQEWLHAAIDLCLAQPGPQPLPALLDAFRPGTPGYRRLLAGCDRPDLTAKFRDLEGLKRKNAVQYETITGASRRLVEPVCTSEVVRLRSRPGPFDWLQALRERTLVAFDGGGIRSREIKRTFFLLVGMQVLHGVRRHFAETQSPLPVVLVLEEAGALGLVTPFVMSALQELRKGGLAIHLITQSSLDFADPGLFEAVLANTPWQAWYQCLSPADQELGGKVFANATFDPVAVHFTRARALPEEQSPASWRALTRRVIDPYYKSPALQEQEYRTRLATLAVGERLVRDRRGVRRELLRPVRSPWLHPVSDDWTRSVIARVRQQPIYQSAEEPPISTAEVLPDAAVRLRQQSITT